MANGDFYKKAMWAYERLYLHTVGVHPSPAERKRVKALYAKGYDGLEIIDPEGPKTGDTEFLRNVGGEPATEEVEPEDSGSLPVELEDQDAEVVAKSLDPFRKPSLVNVNKSQFTALQEKYLQTLATQRKNSQLERDRVAGKPAMSAEIEGQPEVSEVEAPASKGLPVGSEYAAFAPQGHDPDNDSAPLVVDGEIEDETSADAIRVDPPFINPDTEWVGGGTFIDSGKIPGTRERQGVELKRSLVPERVADTVRRNKGGRLSPAEDEGAVPQLAPKTTARKKAVHSGVARQSYLAPAAKPSRVAVQPPSAPAAKPSRVAVQPSSPPVAKSSLPSEPETKLWDGDRGFLDDEESSPRQFVPEYESATAESPQSKTAETVRVVKPTFVDKLRAYMQKPVVEPSRLLLDKEKIKAGAETQKKGAPKASPATGTYVSKAAKPPALVAAAKPASVPAAKPSLAGRDVASVNDDTEAIRGKHRAVVMPSTSSAVKPPVPAVVKPPVPAAVKPPVPAAVKPPVPAARSSAFPDTEEAKVQSGSGGGGQTPRDVEAEKKYQAWLAAAKGMPRRAKPQAGDVSSRLMEASPEFRERMLPRGVSAQTYEKVREAFRPAIGKRAMDTSGQKYHSDTSVRHKDYGAAQARSVADLDKKRISVGSVDDLKPEKVGASLLKSQPSNSKSGIEKVRGFQASENKLVSAFSRQIYEDTLEMGTEQDVKAFTQRWDTIDKFEKEALSEGMSWLEKLCR